MHLYTYKASQSLTIHTQLQSVFRVPLQSLYFSSHKATALCPHPFLFLFFKKTSYGSNFGFGNILGSFHRVSFMLCVKSTTSNERLDLAAGYVLWGHFQTCGFSCESGGCATS